jgi:Ran GTPase-activating protein (RanGAP) involved in mRNA processing and transport
LGDEHISILSLGLRDNKSIKELDLSHNKIGDAGVISLMEHWTDGLLIRELSLHSNRIGPAGAQRLIQASDMLAALTKLNLTDNPSIGYGGL